MYFCSSATERIVCRGCILTIKIISPGFTSSMHDDNIIQITQQETTFEKESSNNIIFSLASTKIRTLIGYYTVQVLLIFFPEIYINFNSHSEFHRLYTKNNDELKIEYFLKIIFHIICMDMSDIFGRICTQSSY